MSNILVFDTSSAWCSAALSVNGTLYAAAEMQPRKHAQLLMPMIDDLCQQAGIKPAEIDGIAFGKGPGSFTGLRIAVSVAQGLSLATGAKLFGISSLQALAWQGMQQFGSSRIIAMMNAHMGEVFYAAYQRLNDSVIETVIDDALSKPEHVDLAAISSDLDASVSWLGAGDGFQFEAELPAQVKQLAQIEQNVFPLAESMMYHALLAWNNNEFTAPELQQPVYLRDTVAWKKLSEQPSLLKK